MGTRSINYPADTKTVVTVEEKLHSGICLAEIHYAGDQPTRWIYAR
jgi:hypothetical protein